MSPPKLLLERFMEKIERSASGCWEWVGSKNKLGYGKMCVDGRRIGAYRMSYELLVETIPVGLEIDHLCRNPSCVNPQHLEVVTPRQNLFRSKCPNILLSLSNRCKRGHDLLGPKARRRENGTRHCQQCDTIRHRERRSRDRLAKEGREGAT